MEWMDYELCYGNLVGESADPTRAWPALTTCRATCGLCYVSTAIFPQATAVPRASPGSVIVTRDALVPNLVGLVLGCIEADFASKYFFSRISKDLQDLRIVAPLHNLTKSQNLKMFVNKLINFVMHSHEE